MLVLDLEPEARAHLARALAGHRRWCATNGYAWPTDLERIRVALSGQERTQVDPPADGVDDADVVPTPVLTYAHAAAYLDGVSERTVRRLVEQGELPYIDLGRTRRIHRRDLDDLLERRRRQGGRDG